MPLLEKISRPANLRFLLGGTFLSFAAAVMIVLMGAMFGQDWWFWRMSADSTSNPSPSRIQFAIASVSLSSFQLYNPLGDAYFGDCSTDFVSTGSSASQPGMEDLKDMCHAIIGMAPPLYLVVSAVAIGAACMSILFTLSQLSFLGAGRSEPLDAKKTAVTLVICWGSLVAFGSSLIAYAAVMPSSSKFKTAITTYFASPDFSASFTNVDWKATPGSTFYNIAYGAGAMWLLSCLQMTAAALAMRWATKNGQALAVLVNDTSAVKSGLVSYQSVM